METNIVGRGLDITDRFRDYVEEKSAKIVHLHDRALALEIKVSRHNEKNGRRAGDDRVELTLVGPGPLIRAEASGSEKYVAFDLAYAKLLERLRRVKDRRSALRGRQRTTMQEATTRGFDGHGVTPVGIDVLERLDSGEPIVDEGTAEPEYSPVVIREKVFPSESMTSEEAVDRMELVGHDFFLFVDARTDRPSVVYRRTGWDYGVIGLEEPR